MSVILSFPVKDTGTQIPQYAGMEVVLLNSTFVAVCSLAIQH